MSIKEISEAIEKEHIIFGLKETLKTIKKSKGKKLKVFVTSDAREETIKKLQENKIDFLKVKSTVDVTKELSLGFECEVFLVK
jgi:ribosomal protein L7Ae-like RNA K-turn-binding protein